nr:MAG TPA: chromosome partitioning protein [Caudoviricetes sp.]
MAFDVSSVFAEELKKVSKSDTGKRLTEVDIDDLVSNEANFYAVDADKLEELKNSIALSGIMDPPTVTETEDGKYRLISGHRRTAAVRALVAEGRGDLRKMPVFVRSPRSAAMEELELIMANSTARVLSSAEVSQAAQRVERLLYELKEQGVEFPGRMRDHVAAACNVSKTKLANLHAIESNCIADFRKMWADGKIPDATALELSRCDTAFQMRMRDAFARLKSFPTAASIESLREMQKNGAKWQPSACLRCPDGRLCPSSRDDAVLRHDATCCSYEPKCKGEMCCMDCEYGAKARGCYDVCDQMCSRAKQYRTDKNAAVKEKEAKAEEKRQRGFRETIRNKAQRLVRAIDAAGLRDDKKLVFAPYRAEPTVKTLRAYANGEFGDAHFYGTDSLDPDAKHVPELCETLRCSADYLLGMTDELTPQAVPKSDSGNGWQTGTDYPDGMILAVFRFPGSDDIRQLMYVQDGKLYFTRKCTTRAEEQPVLWLAIPPIPEEDDDEPKD